MNKYFYINLGISIFGFFVVLVVAYEAYTMYWADVDSQNARIDALEYRIEQLER